jgi:hypothetical protein
MKKYVKASMSGKTQRQRDAAQAAADALWRFQTLGDFHDPMFDALSNEDVELLDSARILLLNFAKD